jgi:hypothetical protein
MMHNSMNGFSYFEAEAKRLAIRIRDLKTMTPEFSEARDSAQRNYERHLQLIEDARIDLMCLRDNAAEAALMLGEEPEEVELPQAAELPQVAELPSIAELPSLAELPVSEQVAVFSVLNDGSPFVVPDDVADAVASMAGADIGYHPGEDMPDRSSEPEMTSEQVEAIERNMAEALKAYS